MSFKFNVNMCLIQVWLLATALLFKKIYYGIVIGIIEIVL